MKKTILILTALFIAISVQSQTIEDIIKKFSAANGYDKLASVKTVKMTGRMSMMGMDLPFEMLVKNPDKMRTLISFNGQEMITVINGNTGFMINPMSGSTDAVDLPLGQIEQQRSNIVFNNYMEEYLKKGKLKLEGTENVKDKPAYKINVAMEGGTTMLVYIDKASYLIAKTTVNTNSNGMDVTAEAYMTDYKDNNGVFIPMKITTSASGMEFIMTYDKVEVNIPIEDSMFMKK